MRRIFLGILLLVMVASLHPAHGAADEADLHDMTAEAFFRLDQVEQPLVRGQINRRLLAAAVFHATNLVRKEHGLEPLAFDPRLARAAAMHSESMAERGYLAHENRQDPKRRWPMDRVLLTGYRPRAVSENVAKGFRVRYEDGRSYYRYERGGETVFSYRPRGEPIPPHTYESSAAYIIGEWLKSPGHRKNILRETSEELGVAVRFDWREQDLDEAYVTQVFGRPLVR